MLGKKQSSKNEEWIYAWEHCTEMFSKKYIKDLTIHTINRIIAVVDSKNYQRIGYCWSGGKDSLVLHDILKKSGIEMIGGMLALYENEFPAFVDWIKKNKPKDVYVYRTGAFSDKYINNNPEILFPVEQKYKDAYLPPRWKAQKKFAQDFDTDCLILGRRVADGNFCGKRENGFITSSQSGDKFNPIAEWKHEEILAYLKYNHIELPSIYFYENGFQGGTQLWTEKRRINGSYFETFDLLMEIDARIIEEAKGRIDLVDEYLNFKKGIGTKK